MTKSGKKAVASSLAAVALATLLSACQSNPSQQAAAQCTPPQETNLDAAFSTARTDLQSGCAAHFDTYFQRLRIVAEGDPGKDNKARFSEFLVWSNNEGLISKVQAREMYNRYFGIKFVSLKNDYSICTGTCPRQAEVMRNMTAELADKEQGLLKVSNDRRGYTRASQLFQETELVLEATCMACPHVE